MMTNEEKIFILEKASEPGGFIPNTRTGSEYAKQLEHEGLLYRSECGPFWVIRDAGREILNRLKAGGSNGKDDTKK